LGVSIVHPEDELLDEEEGEEEDEDELSSPEPEHPEINNMAGASKKALMASPFRQEEASISQPDSAFGSVPKRESVLRALP